MQITIYKIWIPLFFIFLSEKILFAKYEPTQLVVGLLFFFTSVFWFISPYLLGQDIRVPSYSDILRKGENDIARFVCFLVGIFGFVVSLLV